MTRNYGTYLKLKIIFQHTTAVVTKWTIETSAQTDHSFFSSRQSLKWSVIQYGLKSGYMHNI